MPLAGRRRTDDGPLRATGAELSNLNAGRVTVRPACYFFNCRTVLGSVPMFEDPKKPPSDGDTVRRTNPILELGRVVATPGALEALIAAGETGERYLFRHECGDWGDLCAEDREVNERALRLGQRILSEYRLSTGEKLWIITEWDRSVTTLLLPSEY